MAHIPPAARPLLFIVLLALTGCATSRVDFTPAPSMAEVSAADVTAGDALFPIVEGGEWGYMNRRGEVVIAPRYPFATTFSEGRAAVKSGGKWGYISPGGVWVVRPIYDTASAFTEGRALVSRGADAKRRFGFIDASGAEVVPTVLPYALSYTEGLALARLTTANRTSFQALLARLGALPESSGYVFLDRDGRVAFDVPGISAAAFAGGLAPFEESQGLVRSSTWGYLDREGNVVVEPTLDGPAFRHTEGLARVGERGQLGFVDTEGQFVIAPDYDLALAFSDGLAPVSVDGKWGFVNASGDLAIAPAFRAALPFASGLAPVQIGNRWGYVNASGDLAIAADFSSASPFERGLARVYEGRLLRYIDEAGETVWAQE